MQRVHLHITGKVQGVYFRASTLEQAQILTGVTGWVRNCADGAVAVVAEGTKEALDALVAWCQHGPRAARVDACDVSWRAATGEFSAFTIRHGTGDDPFGPDGER
jgi:acylphosphatase